MKRRWTVKETNDLLFWAGEKPIRWIAARLGRSDKAIAQKLLELGVTARGSITTIAAVADRLGVARNTVVRYRDRLRLQWRHRDRVRGYAGPDEDQIRALAAVLLRELPKAPHTNASLARLRAVAEGRA